MNNEQVRRRSALTGPGLRQPCANVRQRLELTRLDDVLHEAPLRAGGIPGQPGPDTPAEPGVPAPEQPTEPGSPTLPDEPPPDPVV
ncbi:MAG: hypothetical protein ACOH2I_16660 [Pseudomonas sp.]